MTSVSRLTKWQDIGWNGIVFKAPSSWQPTVIYPTYLFFEQGGAPVFEIKWQKVQGKFSLQKGIKQLEKTLPENATLVAKDLHSDLQQSLFTTNAAGFQIEKGNYSNDGIIIFCSECNHVILVQWYLNTPENKGLLSEIFQTLLDHYDNESQLLAVYDIRAKLPAQARLQNHELLPGKYTFNFELGAVALTLYRFKPATVLLKNSSLGIFGHNILEEAPQKENEQQALWNYRLHGINFLLAKLRRKPIAMWMRLRHDPDQNAILGIKAEGNNFNETDWLENICKNFISVNIE